MESSNADFAVEVVVAYRRAVDTVCAAAVADNAVVGAGAAAAVN